MSDIAGEITEAMTKGELLKRMRSYVVIEAAREHISEEVLVMRVFGCGLTVATYLWDNYIKRGLYNASN